MRKPNIRTLKDKFRDTCIERKAAHAANLAAFGIFDDLSDVDVFMKDLTREKADGQKQQQRKCQNAENNEACRSPLRICSNHSLLPVMTLP